KQKQTHKHTNTYTHASTRINPHVYIQYTFRADNHVCTHTHTQGRYRCPLFPNTPSQGLCYSCVCLLIQIHSTNTHTHTHTHTHNHTPTPHTHTPPHQEHHNKKVYRQMLTGTDT